MALKVNCPAKVNLFLKIVGLREDGYHDLQTLFAFLDLADELEVAKSQQFSLEIIGQFADSIKNDQTNNLITKTLNLFQQKFGISKNLKIKLTKNIPIGGGLGGGSSNAASFMKILNEIYQLSLTKNDLKTLSLQLGSDIAVFFEESACLMAGRGEIFLRNYRFEPMPAIIINPNIHIATAAIFNEVKNSFDYKTCQKLSENDLKNDDVIALGAIIGNDLTKFVTEENPQITQLINEIGKKQDCRLSAMSGSGATCFGIFTDEASRNVAFTSLQSQFPSYFLTKSFVKSNQS